MDIDINAIFDAVERETETESTKKVQQTFRSRNCGGNDPQSVSSESIWAAVRDYNCSRQWD